MAYKQRNNPFINQRCEICDMSCSCACASPLNKRVNKDSMPCNKPRPSTKPAKKKMVKACENGQEKLIHYGASGYGHNYSDAARKSFRARHKCNEKKSKLSAQYWACKDLWAGKGGSTKSNPKNKKGKY